MMNSAEEFERQKRALLRYDCSLDETGGFYKVTHPERKGFVLLRLKEAQGVFEISSPNMPNMGRWEPIKITSLADRAIRELELFPSGTLDQILYEAPRSGGRHAFQWPERG